MTKESKVKSKRKGKEELFKILS